MEFDCCREARGENVEPENRESVNTEAFLELIFSFTELVDNTKTAAEMSSGYVLAPPFIAKVFATSRDLRVDVKHHG